MACGTHRLWGQTDAIFLNYRSIRRQKKKPDPQKVIFHGEIWISIFKTRIFSRPEGFTRGFPYSAIRETPSKSFRPRKNPSFENWNPDFSMKNNFLGVRFFFLSPYRPIVQENSICLTPESMSTARHEIRAKTYSYKRFFGELLI